MSSPSLNSVLSTLKACVISNPDGVDEDNLNNEFRQLMGTNIPWRELGFKSIFDLIKASPNLEVVSRGNRRVVTAKGSSSAHLSSMINSQKKDTSKKKSVRQNRFIPKKVFARRPYSYSGNNKGYGNSNFPRNEQPVKKTSFRNVDFREKNNNIPKKNQSNNESRYSEAMCRPAGDSSSNSDSFHSISPPLETKPALNKKQNKKSPQSKPAEQLPPKVKPKPLFPPKEEVLKPPKKVTIQIPTPNDTEVKPVLPVKPLSSPPSQTLSPLSPPFSPTQEPSLTSTKQAVTASEPVVYFSPLYLQRPFNLIPPNPMKPGAKRSGKRKGSRHKLMSIKDNSAPGEDSLTARFINLIRAQEWPEPEYRLLPRKGNGNKEVYGCTVRGSYRFDNNEPSTYDYSTIPDEFDYKNEAKEAVSKKAFEDMSHKIREASNYIPITADPDEIISRIYEMVKTSPNGQWASNVASRYETNFSERLPKDWVDLINKSGVLVSEKLADFSHVILPVSQKERKKKPNSRLVLGELEYPETETWDVFVTKIVSSSKVWFRFVGQNYSDWYDQVSTEMCEHYKDWRDLVCPVPEVGEVYVYPSNYGVCRVKVLSLDVHDVARVIFIDHGEEEEVPIDHLCVLDEKFCDLPPQAVSCKLYDLEEYSDNRICNAFLMDKIEGMVLVAEIIQSEPLVLVMNDTSAEEAININQEIVDCLQVDLSLPPSLSLDSTWHNLTVSSIWKTGEIYLQMPNIGLEHLTNCLTSIQEISPDNYLTHPDDIFLDSFYLVFVDGAWLRASIISSGRVINNMVEILLVDTGDILSVSYTNLVPLPLISMVLNEIPPQAIRVRLYNVVMTEETEQKLQSLLKPPCDAVIKVVAVNNNIPEVEVFIRETRGLISVNHTLSHEMELSGKVKNILFEDSRFNFTTIKQVETPNIGMEWDVYIVSVSNPTNFIVIPRTHLSELIVLQQNLQSFYNSPDHVYNVPKLKHFNVGQVCAVQDGDGQWYRGFIDQIMDSSRSQVMIKFCDYGNYSMVSSDKLLTLEPSFLTLPALGISASLAGIRPFSGDWDIDDCLLSQELMLEKHFVTYIRSKEDDKTRGQILKLQVWDTSQADDCDIGEYLVTQNRAKYIGV